MKVLVLTAENGLESKVIDDNDSLRELQKIVGGHIEVVPFLPEKLSSENILALVCEEGKLKSNYSITMFIPELRDYLKGPVIFIGKDLEDFVSIDEKQTKLIEENLTVIGYQPDYNYGPLPIYGFRNEY